MDDFENSSDLPGNTSIDDAEDVIRYLLPEMPQVCRDGRLDSDTNVRRHPFLSLLQLP